LKVVCSRPSQVRIQELRIFAPLLDHLDDRMLAADRAENPCVGRIARLALATGRELELLEEDAGHLLRRAQHEFLPSELVRLGLELLEPIRQAGGDLAHSVRIDADSCVLHGRENPRERELDLSVERFETPLDDAAAERLCKTDGRRGVADQSCGFLLGRRFGLKLDSVLGRQIVERVIGASGLDQVRHQERVVPGLDARSQELAWQRLEVMRNEVGMAELGNELDAPATDDGLLSRERKALALNRKSCLSVDLWHFGLAPRHGDSLELHRSGRERLVDDVDPLEEVPELELAEHLLQPRAIRRLQHELCRVAAQLEVATHGRELLRLQRLLGVLAKRLAARGREVVDVLEDVFQRAVLRDQLACGLVPEAWNPGDVVGAVALEADEVRHLLGRDAVACEDSLGRIDVHVGDAARGHHQEDVLRDELEGVPVR
jgi:hypothetical protein